MEKNESIERFDEGLAKAVSRAREIARAQKNPDWEKIAIHLDKLRSNGNIIYRGKAMARQDALGILDNLVGKKVQ